MKNLILLVVILVVVWLIFGVSNVTLLIAAAAIVWFIYAESNKSKSKSTLALGGLPAGAGEDD